MRLLSKKLMLLAVKSLQFKKRNVKRNEDYSYKYSVKDQPFGERDF